MHEINCRRSGLPGLLAVLAHYRQLIKDLGEGDRVPESGLGEREIKALHSPRSHRRVLVLCALLAT